MNDILKWTGKVFLQMVLWVFILSISWNGRTLFDRAHELLVRNALVSSVDQELADLWHKLSETARLTFSEAAEEKTETF